LTVQFISESPAHTAALASSLARILRAGDVIVFTGNLGTGKTYLAKAILADLCPDQLVHSPSFSLVNIYQAPEFPVYHVDFYRLHSEEELWAAGWEDYLDGFGLFLIEWGQCFPDALPLSYLEISLEVIGEQRRRITLTAVGERGRQLQEEWLNAMASH